MPGMVENWFSSGAATDEAMVSGSAPGRLAPTEMVGKSTLGRSLTGRLAVAEDAEDHQRRHHQRGHHRTFDEGLGDVHRCLQAISLMVLRVLPRRRPLVSAPLAAPLAPRR